MNEQDCFNQFASIDYKSFSEWLSNMNAYEFTLIGTLIGFLIAPQLTVNLQNSLGNFFELIGQVLLTINAQNTTRNPNSSNPSGLNQSHLEHLHQILNQLQEQINIIKK